MPSYTILTVPGSSDYALLDSGDGEKLEQYGSVRVARPDPQALWKKQLAPAEWAKANAYFERTGENAAWKTRGQVPERWPVTLGGLKFWIRLSAFKHTGLFPEQAANWSWMQQKITAAKRPITILNLFGYTGGASLAAAAAGASVVHVDASKVAVNWARDNAELSGLAAKPIRWILDDARKFVKRELKRGNIYDGIIMDPPAFGHGAKGELWKIEDHFLDLLADCRSILSAMPLFFLINGYAAGYSALAYYNNLQSLTAQFGGAVEIGELTIAEGTGERLLPAGIFARWSA